MLVYTSVAILLGFLIDCILGDPHSWWHPVRTIGMLIDFWEKQLRGIFPGGDTGETIAGVFEVIFVLASTMIVPATLVIFAYDIHWSVGILVETILCYQMLAAKSLKDESTFVAGALRLSLNDGRRAVARIVGRDTDRLSQEGVVKAAVETVAENTSDGVIAPLFYMVIGGGVGGYLYKAVNTMDSMIGYKNDRYMYFGTAAAKLDDVLNFIPARLAARLMIFAAGKIGLDAQEAKRIYLRDRNNHDSPNSAHTEAVMAGALGIQLAGDAWYFGKLKKKKTIGDPGRPVVVEDIARANRLMYATTICGLVLMVGIRLLIALIVFLVRLAIAAFL